MRSALAEALQKGLPSSSNLIGQEHQQQQQQQRNGRAESDGPGTLTAQHNGAAQHAGHSLNRPDHCAMAGSGGGNADGGALRDWRPPGEPSLFGRGAAASGVSSAAQQQPHLHLDLRPFMDQGPTTVRCGRPLPVSPKADQWGVLVGRALSSRRPKQGPSRPH